MTRLVLAVVGVLAAGAPQGGADPVTGDGEPQQHVCGDRQSDVGDRPVLWLVAGGIALGQGVGASGLDDWLIGLVDWSALPGMALLVVLAAVALGALLITSVVAVRRRPAPASAPETPSDALV